MAPQLAGLFPFTVWPAPKWRFRGQWPACITGAMTQMLRLFNLLLLCAALAAASVSMAVARGQAAALPHGTAVVICTGYGVMTITLDDQGNPIGPVHPCPECLAGLTTYLPPGPIAFDRAQGLGEKLSATAPTPPPRSAARLITRARGPPLSV